MKPRGVEVRTEERRKPTIRIYFEFAGKRYRETLPGLTDSKEDLQAAGDMVAQIRREISLRQFDYGRWFPESRHAVAHQDHVTVEQAQDMYLDTLKVEKTTMATYRRSADRIANFILPQGRFGDVRVDELRASHIRSLAKARDVTVKTMANDLTPLRGGLDLLVADDVIPYNAIRRVKLDKLLEGNRPKPSPFSLDEIDRIAAAGYCPQYEDMFEFAVHTGLRTEELVALRREDVDLANNMIRVCRAAQLSLRSSRTKKTKTGAGEREVYLLPRARAALTRQLERTMRAGLKVVWFRHDRREPITDYEQIRRKFHTICQKVGVTPRPFSQTRHTYCAHMLSSGHPDHYVAGQVGHKSVTVLSNYRSWAKEWRDNYQSRSYGS